MFFSQKHNNIFNNVKFASCLFSQKHNIFNNVKFATTCFGYSNHHQADISVHGHDTFRAYSMGSHVH
jgi:hypothetical protein